MMLQIFLADVVKVQSVQALTMGFGMVLQLTLLLLITNVLMAFPMHLYNLYSAGLITPDCMAVNFWLRIEWMTIFGLIFSNVLFLLIRTFITHKVSGDTEASNKSNDVDSIYAIREYTSQFNA